MSLFDIDLETLRLSLQQASLAGIGVSFLTGLGIDKLNARRY